MRPEFRVAMGGEALGLGGEHTRRHIATVDARHWAHVPRGRILLSTFPVDPNPWMPGYKAPPWQNGW
eukprot:11216026-Lingulodinium_polyedra.AAC.1